MLARLKVIPALLQALICSAFIPGFSGWICPRVQGVRYVDGGFTNNLPEMDLSTVTVSPFCGESDICPKDTTAGLVTVNLANTSIELSKENLYRFARILFPPEPEVLNKMCQQGFNDALDFLQRNNLISCTRCLAVQSSFTLTEPQDMKVGHKMHEMGEMDDCTDCREQRKEAILDQLPEAVGGILQDAINTANQGLMNWVFKHKSMKLLSILTLPYVLPMDIAYSAFLRFMASAPSARDLQNLAKQVISLIKALLRSSSQSSLHHHHHHHHHDTKFSCQLEITQFSGDVDMQHIHNRQNFDFTLDLDTMEGVPQSHKDAMLLESQALTEVALRCASRSLSNAGSRIPSRVTSRATSRAVSRAVSRRPSFSGDLPDSDPGTPAVALGEDGFERILDVTTHQEALMAYYYLDENNEVRVTEIFDMTGEGDGSGEGGLELDPRQAFTNSNQWGHHHYPSSSIGSDAGSEAGLDTDYTAPDDGDISSQSDTESEYCRRLDRNNPESEQLYSVNTSHH